MATQSTIATKCVSFYVSFQPFVHKDWQCKAKLLKKGFSIEFLPPAYAGRREVMFSQGSVCLSTPGEGGTHLHPIILLLVPRPFWGYPSPRWGYPSPRQGGYPSLGQGTPPQSGQDGVPLSQVRMGYPLGQVMLGQVMLRAVRLFRFPAGGLSYS